MGAKWTNRQDDLIRKHYKYNIEYLFTLKLFSCRTETAIKLRANRLGVKRSPWTNEEDEVIKKCYKDYGPIYCMRYLKGRTEIAICTRALNLDVKRDLQKRKNKLPSGNIMLVDKLMFNKRWSSKS